MPAARVRRPGPVRRFTLGSGPLKRTSDRLQTVSRVVLLLTVLAVVPLSWLVGTSVSGHLHEVVRQQQAHRASVPATLLFDAGATPSGSGSADEVPTPAAWAGADGVPRTGPVPAPAGSRAGSVVRVWVEDSGTLTTAPLGDGDVAADAVAAVVLGPGSVLALVALGHVVLVTALDRRRARRWAEGWAAVEPLWRAGRP
jgi:hypothetical protein